MLRQMSTQQKIRGDRYEYRNKKHELDHHLLSSFKIFNSFFKNGLQFRTLWWFLMRNQKGWCSFTPIIFHVINSIHILHHFFFFFFFLLQMRRKMMQKNDFFHFWNEFEWEMLYLKRELLLPKSKNSREYVDDNKHTENGGFVYMPCWKCLITVVICFT